MADFKVLGTDHHAYTVSDMDQTIGFFRDILGFELLSDDRAEAEFMQDLVGLKAPIRYAYLQGPDGRQLELAQYYGPEDKGQVSYRPCDTGAAHMAIRVNNVPEAVEAAKGAGYTPYNQIVTIEDETGVSQSCHMHNADGLTIEFLSRPN